MNRDVQCFSCNLMRLSRTNKVFLRRNRPFNGSDKRLLNQQFQLSVAGKELGPEFVL